MEHPEVEIERVMRLLVTAASPDIQQAAVRKCVLLKIQLAHTGAEGSSSHNPGGYSGISLAMPAFATRCIA